MFNFYYEEKLTSTNGIAKDWIDVSLTTHSSCTEVYYDIKITSLVDKIVIQKVVIRRILQSRRFKRVKRRRCIYRLTDNKRLTLKKSLSVNYGKSELFFSNKLYRISITTDKGSFDYFHYSYR